MCRLCSWHEAPWVVQLLCFNPPVFFFLLYIPEITFTLILTLFCAYLLYTFGNLFSSSTCLMMLNAFFDINKSRKSYPTHTLCRLVFLLPLTDSGFKCCLRRCHCNNERLITLLIAYLWGCVYACLSKKLWRIANAQILLPSSWCWYLVTEK